MMVFLACSSCSDIALDGKRCSQAPFLGTKGPGTACCAVCPSLNGAVITDCHFGIGNTTLDPAGIMRTICKEEYRPYGTALRAMALEAI